MTNHFQEMLTEIQAQIEQHSSRNDKLCRENSNLTDKLESLMSQCEQREEVRRAEVKGQHPQNTVSYSVQRGGPAGSEQLTSDSNVNPSCDFAESGENQPAP